ncbi:unnamed protein product [Dovyalis caffra]|uniref:Uncharacterized protein n=1 Tax=Dovyalis caffra TaxID=77055 RepID=A0AAV1RJG2_9ROSI|nr:unnamed protein product [Dovyalis caffra]
MWTGSHGKQEKAKLAKVETTRGKTTESIPWNLQARQKVSHRQRQAQPTPIITKQRPGIKHKGASEEAARHKTKKRLGHNRGAGPVKPNPISAEVRGQQKREEQRLAEQEHRVRRGDRLGRRMGQGLIHDKTRRPTTSERPRSVSHPKQSVSQPNQKPEPTQNNPYPTKPKPTKPKAGGHTNNQADLQSNPKKVVSHRQRQAQPTLIISEQRPMAQS